MGRYTTTVRSNKYIGDILNTEGRKVSVIEVGGGRSLQDKATIIYGKQSCDINGINKKKEKGEFKEIEDKQYCLTYHGRYLYVPATEENRNLFLNQTAQEELLQ